MGVSIIAYRASGATQIPPTRILGNQDPFAFPKPSGAGDLINAIVNISGEGITTVIYLAKDKNGNAETLKSLQIKIDYSPPRSSATINTANNTANISLSATDVKLLYNPRTETYEPDPNFPVSNVSVIKYSIDGGTEQSYSSPFTFTGTAGMHTLYYYSVDKAGNMEEGKTENFTLS